MSLGKFLVRLGLILAIPMLAGVCTYFYMRSLFFEPIDLASTRLELVNVLEQHTIKDICRKLEDDGFVRKWWVISFLISIRAQSTEIQIHPGEYELAKSMTPTEILNKLVSGNVFKREVVLEEGQSIWDLGKTFQNAGLISEKEFNAAVTDENLLVRAGITAASFEGYLYPGKYQFSRAQRVDRMIWSMFEEGEKHWPAEYSDQAAKLELNRHEVLTLASLVQAETTNAQDQVIIAGIFHNRLLNVMKIQSKPAVRYGLKEVKGELTDAQLADTSNPYNTFANYGMPPGPICNPGDNAIKSTLFYGEHQHLFFLPDGQGGFIYSDTLKEHNEALARQKSGQAPAIDYSR